VSKRCEHLDCDKKAGYAENLSNPARFCAEHGKAHGCEVDVNNKKCEDPGCNTRPSYAKQLGDPARFCAEHGKAHGCTVDVKSKKCEHPECNTRPCYAKQPGDPARFCAEHGMVNGCTVDVKHKKCEHPGCTKQPSYAKQPGDPARFCAEHGKVHGCTINAVSKICEHPGCTKQPSYAKQPGDPARFCAEHGKAHGCTINVVSKICKSTNCDTRAMKKYDGYCFNCFIENNPETPIARQYLFREKSVLEALAWIAQEFPDFQVMMNKQLGPSRRRPDLAVRCSGYYVIFEVDEIQHKLYDQDDEQQRIAQIQQDIGNLPLIVIRFNPDNYKDVNGKSNPGCFTQDRKVINGIKLALQGERLKARMVVVNAKLKQVLAQPPTTSLEVYKFFFDGSDPQPAVHPTRKPKGVKRKAE
jgi:hypothetical protein